MNAFEQLAAETQDRVGNIDDLQEVKIEDFLSGVVPKASSIELLVENKHANNLMTLIAPVHAAAPGLFKWGNNFSWAYSGDVTDSIKERVKEAGGDVTGHLRCSLSWYNYDDLDIHVTEPNGNRIHFGDKYNRSTGGRLDVDMNAGGRNSREPVENITWPNKTKMREGQYKVVVHNYTKREKIDVGFEVEIECQGELHNFTYDKEVKSNQRVTVATFNFSRKEGITNLESNLKNSSAPQQVNNITTESFQKVNMIMNSPNHWDGEETGNKHWFFILDGCKMDEEARGFFNEFMKPELREHRKVFEMLGARFKAPVTDDQLSGVGFSSTQRNEIVVRVTGENTRTMKVKF
jgi:hypothetical protein